MYKTKMGSLVQLFDADCGGEKPLVGIYYDAATNSWFAAQWSREGHFNVQNKKYIPSSMDLVNPPKFERIEFNDEAA